LDALVSYLSRRGIAAETLGQSFWSIEAPLKPIQREMREVVVSFRGAHWAWRRATPLGIMLCLLSGVMQEAYRGVSS